MIYNRHKGAHTVNRFVCALAAVVTLSLVTAAAGVSENPAPQDDVKKIQQALKDRGCDPGPIDGLVGPKTRRALKRFQRSQGIPVTGQIDSRTVALLCKEIELGPPRNLRVIQIGEQ